MTWLLALHLSLALPTLAVCLYAWFRPDRRLTQLINLCSLATVMSGTILSIAAHTGLAAYCVRLGIYLTVIGFAHLRLAKLPRLTVPLAQKLI